MIGYFSFLYFQTYFDHTSIVILGENSEKEITFLLTFFFSLMLQTLGIYLYSN